MKKTLTLTTLTLLAGALSAYSQGILSFTDGGSSFAIQVFGPQSTAASTVLVVDGAYSGYEEMGDTANANAANTSTGQGITSTAGNTVYAAGTALGTGYTVNLLYGPSTATTYAALTPVTAANGGVVTTWFTAAHGNPLVGFSGFWNSGNTVLLPAPTTYTVAIAAWNNESGTVTSLAAAQAAGDPWGLSAMETYTAGISTVTPASLTDPTITSFSLVTTGVPEPSTIALGVMGVSALLIRRRK
jgi:hypothetical protein